MAPELDKGRRLLSVLADTSPLLLLPLTLGAPAAGTATLPGSGTQDHFLLTALPALCLVSWVPQGLLMESQETPTSTSQARSRWPRPGPAGHGFWSLRDTPNGEKTWGTRIMTEAPAGQ